MQIITTKLLRVCALVVVIIGTSTTLASTCRHLHGRHHVCSEPPDLQQRLLELKTNQLRGQLHETFYLLPFLRDAATNQTKRYNFCMDQLTRSTVFGGSSDCPRPARDSRLGDPCPTYNVINSDPNRYPRILMETRCRCSHCQGIKTSYEGSFVRATCDGVYHHVQVLRRTGCEEGVYRYAAAWEKLQIGCACKLTPIG